MNQYAVLCECPSCHDKSIWYANTDASDMEKLQSEIEEAMVRLVVGGYACEKCGERGLEAMAIKEANELGKEDYTDGL